MTRRWGLWALAVVLGLAWAAPLVWTASSTLKPQHELVGPERRWLPAQPTLENWRTLADPGGRAANIGRAFANSLVVALAATLCTLATSSLAAYAFARLRFRGREALFGVLLATLMIPNEVILVPLFLQFHRLELLDSYAALILPNAISVLGVFLLRQFMRALPRDLLDSAAIDGAGPLRAFWHVVLPLSRSPLATLSVIAFLGSWNDFLWPLIAVTTPDKHTLPLALVTFRSAYQQLDYGIVLAAALVAVVPPLLFFLFAQRYVIAGISRSGLKG